MTDYESYGIIVRKDVFEGEECYEARIHELPDLVEYADSAAEAYELAVDSIFTTAQILAEQNRTMPAPQKSVHDYSGRVTLRLPKSLHRELAMQAQEEGVSLNQLLVATLARQSGQRERAVTEDTKEQAVSA